MFVNLNIQMRLGNMCISLHAHVIITRTFQIFNIRNSNNVDALHILDLTC